MTIEGRQRDGNKTYNLLIFEMIINVAIALKLRNGRSPSRRIRIPARDVTWNGAAGKEPDIDICTGPLCGVDATANGVETTAIGLRILVLDAAASVAALTGITVTVTEGTGEPAVFGNGAACGGVQGHGVVGVVVDAFDYVDFTFVWLQKLAADMYTGITQRS